MDITDSQVHLITPHSPERPWPHENGVLHGWTEFGQDRLPAEMDTAGVARAVIVPPSAEGDRNDTSLAAAHAHPDRFAVMGRVDLTNPDSRRLLPTWRNTPGMLGIRVTFRRGVSARWLDDGTAAWFWPAAEGAQIPLYVHVPGLVMRVHEIAERHPALKLTIDHLGITASVRPHQVGPIIDEVITLARHPNVAVKASSLPSVAADEYPFRSVHDHVRRVLDAFGPQRVFWGSDITRLPCSYERCVTMFTEALDFLSGTDLELVMGRGLEAWIGWDTAVSENTPLG